MASLTVRNLSDDVMEALKTLARRNSRSLEEQVRQILGEVAVDRAEALKLVEASWKRQSRPTTKEEVDAWLESSRGA